MPKSKKFIPIPKTENVGIKVEQLEKESKFIRALMIGIIIVLFISFLGFVIDAFLYRVEAYKNFNKTLYNNQLLITEKFYELKLIKKDIQDIKSVLNMK